MFGGFSSNNKYGAFSGASLEGELHTEDFRLNKGGRLSELQKRFADDVIALRQNYVCLWSKEMIDEWIRQRI